MRALHKRYGAGISMASVQISQHFKKTKRTPEILNFLRLKDARKTYFSTFSMIGLQFALTKTTAIVCTL